MLKPFCEEPCNSEKLPPLGTGHQPNSGKLVLLQLFYYIKKKKKGGINWLNLKATNHNGLWINSDVVWSILEVLSKSNMANTQWQPVFYSWMHNDFMWRAAAYRCDRDAFLTVLANVTKTGAISSVSLTSFSKATWYIMLAIHMLESQWSHCTGFVYSRVGNMISLQCFGGKKWMKWPKTNKLIWKIHKMY